jgi:hypothetical protein
MLIECHACSVITRPLSLAVLTSVAIQFHDFGVRVGAEEEKFL